MIHTHPLYSLALLAFWLLILGLCLAALLLHVHNRHPDLLGRLRLLTRLRLAGRLLAYVTINPMLRLLSPRARSVRKHVATGLPSAHPRRAVKRRVTAIVARHEAKRRVRVHGAGTVPQAPTNVKHAETLSLLDRIALVVTDHIGRFGTFLLIAGWTVVWLGWNIVAPHGVRFDPAPAFVLWLFISNMIQICLMPLLMIGQNLQSRHQELRAESDHQAAQQMAADIAALTHKLDALLAMTSPTTGVRRGRRRTGMGTPSAAAELE